MKKLHVTKKTIEANGLDKDSEINNEAHLLQKGIERLVEQSKAFQF